MPALRRLRAAAVDIGPLRRSPAFRRLWAGQLVSMLGRQVTTVALPYQVFALTHSTLAVGTLGLVQLVPLLCASLFGGAIADRANRRTVLLITNVGLASGSTVLALAALSGSPPVALLFVVAGVVGAVGAVDQPARSATIPNLVSAADLPGAMALNFGLFSAALVIGPALGGVLIGALGLPAAYFVDVATFGAAIAAVVSLPSQPPRHAAAESPLRAIATGLRYVGARRDILGSFAIDIVAMVFGMPRALYPVLAAGTYHTGPQGLGLLYAAPGAGALLAIVAGGGAGRVRHLGRLVVFSVIAWGLAIAVAGAVPVLWVALLGLAVAGAADCISAIGRSTMMQASTPDHLRGRLSATFTMVVAGGPYLGDIEAGGVAAATSPRVSFVSGGLLCLVGVAAVCAAFPQLWRYRREPAAEPDALTGR